MSTFGDLRNAALAGVDGLFAENIRLSFMTKDGFVDPDRPQRFIKGVLRVGQGKTSNLGAGSGKEWNTRIYSGVSELHIDPVAWPDLVIRSGDAVLAMDRPGQPVFQVSAVDSRGATRLVVKLGNA